MRPWIKLQANHVIGPVIQKHGDELVGALLLLTKDKDARARLGAIQAALGHGWGKPVQGVDLGVAVEITGITRTIVDSKVIEHEDGEGACRKTDRALR